MTGQAMHASINLGFYKLIIMPPNRPNDSSSLVAKISGLTPLHQTTLLKLEPHKESSTLTGLDRRATPWVFLGLEWTWVMGFFFYHISPFSMRLDCFQWSLSCYAEVCCVNSIKIHSFRWNGGLRWVGNAGAVWKWKTSCLCHVWEDGSYCSSLY